ncbi:class I SAM-dependent DNA methyltransferase [Rufibacter roseus]|uniref:Class I SAM-dependent DNA methyltransferase n=2 Tax=Rufibacter roseus TaxID=1567108 RepID=A0ABW2DQ56_9BACT|nr:class I SAM-dependent methyltransferase [Rufibacter roseus]
MNITYMDSYIETFETWNKIASVYEGQFMGLDLYNETYDYLCNTIIKEEASILDVGCGPGNITKYLLSKRPDFQINGIDIAPNMVRLAKSNNPTASFHIMDSRHISELKTKYEGIICGFCLPYLSEADCTKLIYDTHGLLSDTGFLYLSFVEGNQKDSGFKVGSTGDRMYFYYHNLNFIKAQLIENEFNVLETFHIEYVKTETFKETHTIVIAKKKTTA